MTTLTMREWIVYTFIAAFIQRNDYAPSQREIAHSLGKQPGAGITHTPYKLEAKGLISMPYDQSSRAISLVRGVEVGVEI